MNEEWLHRLRKEPDPRFADSLYRRVSRQDRRVSRYVRLAVPAIALLALALLISQPVTRNAFATFAREIGDLLVVEGAQPEPPSTPWPASGQVRSLADAQSDVPFRIGVPSWLPAGYSPEENVTVIHHRLPANAENSVEYELHLSWTPQVESTTGAPINLTLLFPAPTELRTDTGTVIGETTVAEQPAVIIRLSDTALSLVWTNEDNVLCDLTTTDTAIGIPELTRIAESMP